MSSVRRLGTPDCTVRVDGVEVSARRGESVAALLLATGSWWQLQCGMGACFACTVTIDERPNVRACVESVRPGMAIETPARCPTPTS
jgi:ferredoxin